MILLIFHMLPSIAFLPCLLSSAHCFSCLANCPLPIAFSVMSTVLLLCLAYCCPLPIVLSGAFFLSFGDINS